MKIIALVDDEQSILASVSLALESEGYINYGSREVNSDGIGQIGGITLKKEGDVDSYLNYIISEHKKRNPGIKIIDSYVGLKKE